MANGAADETDEQAAAQLALPDDALQAAPPAAEAQEPPDDPARIESSEVYRLLAEAIDDRLVVVAHYKGGAARRLCPDRIGIDDDDQYQVEAFQLSGPSSRGSGEGQWKCFHLHNLEVMGTETEGWVDSPRASTASNCFHLVVHPTPGTQ